MEKTHIVMLLDESGSMGPHQQAVVETFNEYKNTVTLETKRAFISLYKFDNGGAWVTPIDVDHEPILREVFVNRKAKDCYDLTKDQYQPRGGTPLYDAVAELIKLTKKRLGKDAKVMFMIHTDGCENCSREYDSKAVKAMIEKLEKKRGWIFTYLGEGKEAWNTTAMQTFSNSVRFNPSTRGQTMSAMAATTNFVAANAKTETYGSKTLYETADVKVDDLVGAEADSE